MFYIEVTNQHINECIVYHSLKEYSTLNSFIIYTPSWLETMVYSLKSSK